MTIGVVEVAGVARALEDGFAANGWTVKSAAVQSHRFGYPSSAEPLRMARLCQELNRRRPSSRLPSVLISVVEHLLRAAMVLQVASRRGVVVFVGGQTFLRGWDVPLLRMAGVRVAVLYLGSDSRPPYLNGAYEEPTIESLTRATRVVARRLWRTERWANLVLVNPLSAHLHRRPFVCLQLVGIPSSRTPAAERQPARDEVVRLLHAPSRPKGKGTALIRDAVESVRQLGHTVEYTELIGVPNHEVLRHLAQTDLVLDQAYSDTDLAGLALEAAWLGVPALVGSNDPDAVRKWIGAEVDDRVFLTTPDGYAERLLSLLADERQRRSIGAAAQRFVEQRCSPNLVAERLMSILESDAELARTIDAAKLDYIHGWGLSASDLKDRLQDLVNAAGVDVLHLPPDSEARRLILEFIGEDTLAS